VLREKRLTLEAIGDLLGIHPTTAMRDVEWLEEREPEESDVQSALEDLEALISSQELDAQGRFQAGVARRLAQRLDRIAASDKAQDAIAMPQISKELRAVVADIMGTSQNDKEWLAGLFIKGGPDAS
jgi:hypothetical protein